MSDLIAAYANSVGRSLSFDAESADRLAAEVEDHLHEAMDHAGSGLAEERARIAISRFGSPSGLVAAYTVQIFPQRLKATWRTGLFMGALVLMAMWLRRALILTQWVEDSPAMTALLLVDSIAFRAAIVGGLVAWVTAVVSRSAHHRTFLVCVLIAAAGALTLSIGASIIVGFASVVLSGGSSSSLAGLACALAAGGLMAILAARLRMVIGYAGLMAKLARRPNEHEMH